MLVEVPLTDLMMRELAYHCALFYQKNTGSTSLMPKGFDFPTPVKNDPNHPPLTPAPEPRVRTRATVAIAELPVARVRVRTTT